MSTVSISTSLTPDVDAVIVKGSAGAAIAAGEWVYYDTSAGQYKVAQADSSTTEADVKGVALNDANAAGQPVSVQTDGSFTVSAGLGTAVPYVLSDTAGDMNSDWANDLTAGTSYITQLGVSEADTGFRIAIQASGNQIPS